MLAPTIPLPVIPAEPPFLQKWTLQRFLDTEYQKWDAATFREFATDINSKFARLDTLNTNQVRGALFRVPYLALVNGQLTVPTALIPPRFRIRGMDVRAVNGTDPLTTAAGVKADPVDFRLLPHSAGTVDALVDEQPNTTATVKCAWVRTSGTNDQKVVSYPVLPLEDVNVYASEVYQHTFTNLTPAVTRLLEIRQDITSFSHPVPTGLDSDPYYKPFAPLTAGTAGYSDAQARAAQLNQVAPAGATTLTFTASQDYKTLYNGTFGLDATGAVVGAVVYATLAPGVSALAIPTNDVYDVVGTHTGGKTNVYAFRVMADGRILVAIVAY